MPFPKLVKPFTAEFTNVGLSNESLRLTSTYPLGVSWERSFLVGTECFLESPNEIALVPDEQLIASLAMSAILAGEILPGTKEFKDAITNQDSKYFQTIVGDVRLKAESAGFYNPNLVDDLTVGPEGTVFDVTFQRGTTSNTKVVRIDAWSISQYGNRVDSVDHASYVVPGAIHKELNLKKSQLGAAESANRQAVIDFVASKAFWV